MTITRTRQLALALDLFVAATATGGGLALASGMEGARFPVQWLSRTPWTSYLAPGLILALAVGGSAALAALAVLRRPAVSGWACMLAGIVLAGQITGELLLLTKPGKPSTTEICYLAVAAAMVTVGVRLLKVRPRPRPTG